MTENELIKWLIPLIQSNNMKVFYNSTPWKHARLKALERDNDECQKCKARGGYSPAQCVHHMKHVKKCPQLALELDNLISLCNECHNEEHPEKLRVKPRTLINTERW